MVFSGITFLMFFLPAFFAVYFLLPDKFKNTWIVLASLLFYSWGAPVFIITVVASCFIDYLAVVNLGKRYGKTGYYLAIFLNLALLGYFKYADFFIENFNHIAIALTGYAVPLANVVLPIGISFMTFQKVSYLVDVKRGDCEAQPHFLNHLLFVLLFPQLIAGPIVRYKEIGTQITNRFGKSSPTYIFYGLVRFITGLGKKVFIANILGSHADAVFNSGNFSELTFIPALSGILAYTFQIYFDFAAYSDMAIGLGKMMGFDFPENFNFPYASRSITEFWRRWHITLGNWMKDYLYIPLGGNRSNRTYVNLMVVFLLSGLWHGASWNFVIWGLFHGMFLVFERVGYGRKLESFPGIAAVAYTFIVAMAGWILFRTNTVADAFSFVGALCVPGDNNLAYLASLNGRIYSAFAVALLFSFVSVRLQHFLNNFFEPSGKSTIKILITGTAMLFLYVLCLGELMATGFNPFIYFRF